MANMITITKVGKSRLRRLPFLPRVGFVAELGRFRLTVKHTPRLETLLNLKDRGFSWKNLVALASEEVAEIVFPTAPKAPASVKPLRPIVGAEAHPKKKSAPQAAARKKSEKAAPAVEA